MQDVIAPVKEFILTRYLVGEDPSLLTPTTPLISGGILDSLSTLELVTFLEERFDIQLEAHEADRDRLDTLSAIAALVEAKRRSTP
ncbi:MAG TPA: acyl carrier protein [Gemmatimonadales bacterium]|nr:acyl carrier protein [Gemmatimonadales bacterium]